MKLNIFSMIALLTINVSISFTQWNHDDSHTHRFSGVDFSTSSNIPGDISDASLFERGISLSEINGNNSTYPIGYGTLATFKRSDWRTFQIFFNHGHNQNLNRMWIRNLYTQEEVHWDEVYHTGNLRSNAQNDERYGRIGVGVVNNWGSTNRFGSGKIRFEKSNEDYIDIITDNNHIYFRPVYGGVADLGSSLRYHFPGKYWQFRSELRIQDNLIVDSNIAIGCTDPGNYKLAVNGTIRAKEVKIETGWADFVFEEDYNLMPISELELFIKQHGHLPQVPKAEQVEAEGVNLGEMNVMLLQKIEELTLYVIDLQQQIIELNNK